MLAIGVLAITRKSVSFSITALVLHLLAMVWSMFRVVNGDHLHADYDRIVEENICQGASILPGYWTERRKLDIPTLALDALGLVVLVVLTYIFMMVSNSPYSHPLAKVDRTGISVETYVRGSSALEAFKIVQTQTGIICDHATLLIHGNDSGQLVDTRFVFRSLGQFRESSPAV